VESESDPLAVERAWDPESAEWLRVLDPGAADHEEGLARLHGRLITIARHEAGRRSGGAGSVTGPELADLAHQAAADAMLGILAKLSTFRGESRFTTWAYRFVVLEVSQKLGRHFWRGATPALDIEHWERLPERLGSGPAELAESAELVAAVRRAVGVSLTEHQRAIFVAIVLEGVPLDAMTARLGLSRGAVYKAVFDARRKIRADLVANGYLHDTDPSEGRRG
jgi:RNA polymerase sigma-70 factor (ECF subfamily)